MANTVRSEIRSSVIYFSGLIVGTLAVDGLLHSLGFLWIGMWFGPAGLSLIIISFLYSARRRKWITQGKVVVYLRIHEFLAWFGTLLVLVHSGIHFNALIPWLATLAMLITTASGLTGKYLLKAAQVKLKAQKAALKTEGVDPEQIEEHLLSEARLVNKMKQWRIIHFPITLSFALLVLTHLGGLLYYGWP